MPTYVYKCKECNTELVAKQKITDEPIKKCPHCAKISLEKVIQNSNFSLKGGGWYKDGY